MGGHFLLQWFFPPRDQTQVSGVSCITGGFFISEPKLSTEELMFLNCGFGEDS